MARPSQERQDLCGHVLDGRYRVSRQIGVGGTGVVFEAACERDAGRVAIKTLRPCFVGHPDLGRRLQREAEVARRVRHPGVVQVLDEGILSDGSPYVVMPLLSGESLARLLSRRRQLTVRQVAVVASRVAAILHSAHCAGYVHRDVKPEHVLLGRSATDDLTIHLLDFGVCASTAAPADERMREEGKVFGTPSYVSPEQASGRAEVDARADLFGLGMVMFECLTGKLPFRAPSVSKLLLRIIREQAPRVSDVMPGVDRAMDALVDRLLRREPGDRLPSARALARALSPHVGNRGEVERKLAAGLNVASLLEEGEPTTRKRAVSIGDAGQRNQSGAVPHPAILTARPRRSA
ncbi:MAG: serine/threonine-protein kinase [Myxococcales bacterium]|nr:serine/threonine-protein kinase [Myxococcales bacterium]MDD9965468.1 serine/threonine-protein kinase [Myxococcales bacterium]